MRWNIRNLMLFPHFHIFFSVDDQYELITQASRSQGSESPRNSVVTKRRCVDYRSHANKCRCLHICAVLCKFLLLLCHSIRKSYDLRISCKWQNAREIAKEQLRSCGRSVRQQIARNQRRGVRTWSNIQS